VNASNFHWIGMVLQRKLVGEKLVGDLLGASWIDGTAVDFGSPLKNGRGNHPWGVGQPSNTNNGNGEVCVQMYPKSDKTTLGTWNDAPCGWRDGYICQKPASP
jgi:hypothetical protein